MLSYDLGSINMINLNIYVMLNVQREQLFSQKLFLNDIILFQSIRINFIIEFDIQSQTKIDRKIDRKMYRKIDRWKDRQIDMNIQIDIL